MKRIILILCVLTINMAVYAQIESPVKWSYAAKKISGTEAVVFLKATIQDGWHIYSLNLKDGGPIKTSFTFSPSKEYRLSGKATEPAPLSKIEKAFNNMTVTYFEKSVIFQQKIKLKTANATVVKGQLEFMTCNDKKCLPPENIDFSIPVGK
jgi:DsbC/DsbD-like thiol-disulfide interchange protein